MSNLISSQPDPNTSIEVFELTKRFENILAVDSLSFKIPKGQLCALLGGNGAGKTTTIAMLLGLLIPTHGEIYIEGVSIIRDRYRILPRINFTSPYVDLPHRLKLGELLNVYGRLYGVPHLKQRIQEVAEQFSLNDLLKRHYGSLSAGQKTRVSLAKALLNKPDVLIMDEPTASLDPDTADRVREYLEHYQKQTSATILLASHNMLEVERLAHFCLVMKHGSACR